MTANGWNIRLVGFYAFLADHRGLEDISPSYQEWVRDGRSAKTLLFADQTSKMRDGENSRDEGRFPRVGRGEQSFILITPVNNMVLRAICHLAQHFSGRGYVSVFQRFFESGPERRKDIWYEWAQLVE